MHTPEIYEGRTVSAYNNLDRRHWDAACGYDLDFLGGSLDAPERMPAGSVRDYGKREPWLRMTLVSRPDLERLHADREALAARLIAQLKGLP